jgi:TRAP-type mannitol/chloroaromatic compound transport system permease small subunit
MQAFRKLVRTIDHFTEMAGKLLAWLCLGMAIITCLVVFLRYGFGIGSIATQESVTYMHGMVFMLGAAYTLKQGGHVRVDIFYRRFSERTRAWVNSLGALVFLIPLCVFLVAVSWQFVADAWSIREGSPDPGGIHGVFLLKTLIPLMALNLLLQAIAELLRNALVLVEVRD